ncbi:MAG: single-stranded DNA-binding protein [Candidatus Woesearchaeota archaeon]
MSADNSCNFTGRLTREPDLKYTQQGTAVCTIDLAVYAYYSKKDDEEKTVFPRMKMYGERAENIAKNLDKGQMVSINAEYRCDTDGQKYYPYFLIKDIRFKTKAKKQGRG